MNKFFLYSKIFPASLLLLSISNCKPVVVLNSEVSLLYDITEKSYIDSIRFKNDLQTLLSMVVQDSTQSEKYSGEIRFSALNELSQNAAIVVNLPADDSGILGSNPYVRKEQVQSFKIALANASMKFKNSITLDKVPQSKIYQGLCRELNRLSNDAADKKSLIVYSDFLENSELFSFYLPDNQSFLDDPVHFFDSVLNQACPIPELNNIDIYLVAFRTSENDLQVNKALKFWKIILEHKGAKVKTGVDLQSMQ